MSWLDKAKVLLGVLDPQDIESTAKDSEAKGADRPSLDGVSAAPQQSLEDAFVAREAGDLERMRTLLREMDRGSGLRTVIRAAAALEAQDETELQPLLDNLAKEKNPWRLLLQTAAALGASDKSDELRSLAEAGQAPAWALAWCEIDPDDQDARRHGLVKLLFCDPALARTVAARDLRIEGAEADISASARYAGFAHGRDSIARFGPALVAQVLERSLGAPK